MLMDTLRLCPQCREPLPTDATGRLCPRCQSDPGRTPPSGRPGPISAPPLTPADIAPFFPQLEILELLGHGGMGMVYKARQPQLNRLVALKILAPELSRDPAFAERFAREAQSLARLNQSNIVGIYDFGRAGDFYYFLMEYVDGINLHTLMHGHPFDPAGARRIVGDVCLALQYAHEEGVVHRDIKPSNILIDKRGRVKIADFGLAKLARSAGEDPARGPLTTMVMGTPHYMAPEQIEKPAQVDHRADIYSLGVVFYEMLTGELPLGRFGPPSGKLPEPDERLDAAVLRALEKDPGRRHQQASEMRAAIEPPPPTTTTAPQPQRQWSFLRQLAVITVTALLTVLCYVLIKKHQAHPPSQQIPASDYGALSTPADMPLMGRRLVAALQLTKAQTQPVNRVIRRYQRAFVTLERRHTTHTQDKNGHVHITVNPFPDDMKKLMDQMWQDLAAILTSAQLATAHTLNFERFFPHTGQGTVHIEIWRDPNGEEHFVESENPGNARPMPPRYRFYLPENQ